MKFNIVITVYMINIVITVHMNEESYYNNNLFIYNTQLISNERSITERIIYNISLVWVGFG